MECDRISNKYPPPSDSSNDVIITSIQFSLIRVRNDIATNIAMHFGSMFGKNFDCDCNEILNKGFIKMSSIDFCLLSLYAYKNIFF